MRSRQLKFVFAASPPGGGESGPSDASGGRDFLLHIANRRTANDLGASEADASRLHRPLAGQHCPSAETGTQRAGCVTHKSGSERGPGAKAPGPTRPTRPARGHGQPRAGATRCAAPIAHAIGASEGADRGSRGPVAWMPDANVQREGTGSSEPARRVVRPPSFTRSGLPKARPHGSAPGGRLWTCERIRSSGSLTGIRR